MTRRPLAKQIFGNLMAVFLVAAFAPVPSHAQQDFIVMVNGPWQFVDGKDSLGNKRLFVVAPYDRTHDAYIWSGTNASMMNWLSNNGTINGEVLLNPNGTDPTNHQYQLNVYALDPPSGYSWASLSSKPHGKREMVYETKTKVSSTTINNVLNPPDPTSQRYAISLPVPDSVRAYTGGYGPGISVVQIGDTTLADGGGTEKPYGTWTVLHYGITPSEPPSMDLKSSQTTTSVAVVKDAYNRYGISIALIEAPLCDGSTPGTPLYYPGDCKSKFPTQPIPYDNPECDNISGLSFSLAAHLWGLSENALFPREENNSAGRQISGSYDYDECPLSGANYLQSAETLQKQMAARYLAIADLQADISDLERIPCCEEEQRSSKSILESKIEQSEVALFSDIKSDLELVFKNEVPDNLSDAFYCACVDEIRSPDTCKLDRMSSSRCRTRDRKASIEELETAFKMATGNDKGSSDCHAPQISINGAIQP